MGETEEIQMSACQARGRARLREIAAEIYRMKNHGACCVVRGDPDLRQEIQRLEQEYNLLDAQVNQLNSSLEESFSIV